jgi:hypothetical protein
MSIVWTVDDHPDGELYELRWVAAIKGLEIEEAGVGDLAIRWRGEQALSLSREEAGDLASLLKRYAETGSIC